MEVYVKNKNSNSRDLVIIAFLISNILPISYLIYIFNLFKYIIFNYCIINC